jgi:hypothetical protein
LLQIFELVFSVLKLEALLSEVFQVAVICLVDLLFGLVKSAHYAIHRLLFLTCGLLAHY